MKAKYRVAFKDGRYYPQRRVLFWWVAFYEKVWEGWIPYEIKVSRPSIGEAHLHLKTRLREKERGASKKVHRVVLELDEEGKALP